MLLFILFWFENIATFGIARNIRNVVYHDEVIRNEWPMFDDTDTQILISMYEIRLIFVFVVVIVTVIIVAAAVAVIICDVNRIVC